MSTEIPLRQSGWATDEEWAAALGEEVKTFREKIRKHGIRHGLWGERMLVLAEDLFANLELRPDPKKKPPDHKRRRKSSAKKAGQR